MTVTAGVGADVEMSRSEALAELESEVGVMIRRVRRVIGERARAVHPDLQPASYLMLGYVRDHGPIRASAVGHAFDIDKGAISRQVQHLLDLGLLDRTGHRIKTHGRGWKHRQPRPGVYLWRTPHGYWCRVDPAGTHPLGTTPSSYDLEGLAPDPRSAHERAFADLIREYDRPD